VLHPDLRLGEAHAVARLVRRTVLARCGPGSAVEVHDVDVDLELADR